MFCCSKSTITQNIQTDLKCKVNVEKNKLEAVKNNLNRLAIFLHILRGILNILPRMSQSLRMDIFNYSNIRVSIIGNICTSLKFKLFVMNKLITQI